MNRCKQELRREAQFHKPAYNRPAPKRGLAYMYARPITYHWLREDRSPLDAEFERELGVMRSRIEGRIPAAINAMDAVPVPSPLEIHEAVEAWCTAENREHAVRLQDPEGAWLRYHAERAVMREFNVNGRTYTVLAAPETPGATLASWALQSALEEYYQRRKDSARRVLRDTDSTLCWPLVEDALQSILP